MLIDKYKKRHFGCEMLNDFLFKHRIKNVEEAYIQLCDKCKHLSVKTGIATPTGIYSGCFYTHQAFRHMTLVDVLECEHNEQLKGETNV